MTKSVALLLSFLLSATAAARADDFGPASSIQAVRYDVVRLLAHKLRDSAHDPSALVLSDTVVAGDTALTSWRDADLRGLMMVRKQRGQWWDVFDGLKIDGGGWSFDGIAPLGPHSYSFYAGPTPQLLLGLHLPATLVAEARVHNADVRTAKSSSAIGIGDPYCEDFCKKLSPAGGSFQSLTRSDAAGYELIAHLSANTAARDSTIKRVYARTPTEGESTQALHGDAFFFFTVELSGSKPVTFKPGTTVDVWFPHLLDANRHYGLTGAMSNTAFGPVRATLADNTLHFVLPEFTVAPNDPVMFEIDGDF